MRKILKDWAKRECEFRLSEEENKWLKDEQAIVFYGYDNRCINMNGMLEGEIPCDNERNCFSIDKELLISKKYHDDCNMATFNAEFQDNQWIIKSNIALCEFKITDNDRELCTAYLVDCEDIGFSQKHIIPQNMLLSESGVEFENEEWMIILIRYLHAWTEIPLNPTCGYDLENLEFFNGLIGYLIKTTEYNLRNYPEMLDEIFIDSWKYEGKLYRVLHPHLVEDSEAEDGVSLLLPEVDYHGMITHWTDDYTFSGLMYKLNAEEEYIILEADTKEHIAFDVNKFRKVYDFENPYTAKEREFIFPMYKDCIKEYRMSIKDFISLKNKVTDK